MIHLLERTVHLGADIQTIWEFIRTPQNLNIITPEDLQFQILSDVPATMYDGLLIEYSIRIPGLGRRKWLTEIKHIRERHCFVDEQRSGPFRFWYHYHQIEPHQDGGTICIDRVSYIVGYPVVGELLHSFYIRQTLERIFDFRQKKLREIFPLPP